MNDPRGQVDWREWVEEHLPPQRLGFLIVLVVLAVAALGLNVAVQSLKLHFKKQRVELTRPLDKVDAKLGHWLQVSKDEPLSKETQDTLATDTYIFRDYVDLRLVPRAAEMFKDKSSKDRKELVAKLQESNPNAVISVAVTYYTGMVDTVAHIPDRCYIADGYQPTEYKVEEWLVNQMPINVRFISFEDQTGLVRRAVNKNVVYFFHVNGRYECDPLQVRFQLQDLFQRYGYYLKVELLNLVRDREESAAIMRDFLESAMPAIRQSFPDWEKINSSK